MITYRHGAQVLCLRLFQGEKMIDEKKILKLAVEHSIKHYVHNDHSDGYDDFIGEMRDRMIERARCHLDIDPEPTEYKIEDRWRRNRLLVRVWELGLRENQRHGIYSPGDMHKEDVLQYVRHLERQLGIPVDEGCLKEINNGTN